MSLRTATLKGGPQKFVHNQKLALSYKWLRTPDVEVNKELFNQVLINSQKRSGQHDKNAAQVHLL